MRVRGRRGRVAVSAASEKQLERLHAIESELGVLAKVKAVSAYDESSSLDR